MSVKRRSAGPIRQLSLQNPLTTSSRRPTLKKQQSVDSDSLWSLGNSVNGDAGLRITASSIRSGGEVTLNTKKVSGRI
ncbi:hypothetical protein L9F63_017028 [Diploptera punctata]|uniref:Uncharacterized protein n=1 Tax=Diploptera punctata TaxID=6984 RepID=A0AAD8EGW2_DIPPU|nr:hypothetical protein L9F63_017028 [Diploptera punctata]